MPAGAFAVHGLSDMFLSDKPLFHEVVEDLIDFLGECPLVAHNAAFDFCLPQRRARALRPAAGFGRADGRYAGDRARAASRREA